MGQNGVMPIIGIRTTTTIARKIINAVLIDVPNVKVLALSKKRIMALLNLFIKFNFVKILIKTNSK